MRTEKKVKFIRSQNLITLIAMLVVSNCSGTLLLYGQIEEIRHMLRRSDIWLGDQSLNLEIPLTAMSGVPDYCDISAREGFSFDTDLVPGEQIGLAELVNFDGHRIGVCLLVAGSADQAYIDCNRNGPTSDDPYIQRVSSSQLMLGNLSSVFPDGLPEGCLRTTGWAGPVWSGPYGELDLSLRYQGVTETVRKVVNQNALSLVATGELAGLNIGSSLVFTNNNSFPVDLRYNFWNNNQATSFKVGTSVGAQFNYRLDPHSTLRQIVESPDGKFLSAAGTYEVTSGKGIDKVDVGTTWRTSGLMSSFSRKALVDGEGAQVSFQNDSTVLGEAGLATPTLSSFQVVSVERVTAEGRDTSLAIFNPTSVNALLTLTLIQNDQVVSQTEVPLNLNARSNVTGFFWELLGLQPTDFSGTLEISSSADVGVISLSTLDGIQQSSLPAGAE